MPEQTDILKICPVCNSVFTCKHSADCWCSEIKIPTEVSSFLKKNYDDCLCKNCLLKTIENNNLKNQE